MPDHIASRREVPVPMSALTRYAGEYEFENERWIVVVENGKLFGVATKQKYQLHPESERMFFVYEFDEQFEFEVDAGGRVVGVVEHSRGRERRARKVR